MIIDLVIKQNTDKNIHQTVERIIVSRIGIEPVKTHIDNVDYY